MNLFRKSSRAPGGNKRSTIKVEESEQAVVKMVNPNLDRFKQKATLGTGTFGRVKLVQDRETKKHYALKILKKAQIIKLKQVDHIKNEKRILEQLNHPFIVNMLGSFQNDRNIFMVLEFIPGGELFSLLRKENQFANEVAMFYAGQIVLAFEYLQSLNIVYRDLKPENLLVGADGYLKIADFGFAKKVDDRTWTLCGTPEYLAPEIIQSRGHGKGVDWWALGVLIFEMMAGYPPFYDESAFGIYQQILKGAIEFPKHFSKTSKDLIRKLLSPDYTKRFGCLKGGAQDIKTHPWFKNMDWDSLHHKRIKAPFIPPLKAEDDTSNFDEYPESDGTSGPVVDQDGSIFGDF